MEKTPVIQLYLFFVSVLAQAPFLFPTLSSSSSNTGDKLQEQEAVATRSSSSSISKMGPAQRVHVITAADALASAATRGVFHAGEQLELMLKQMQSGIAET